MRAELFYWVLNMSIIGSVAGLLVLSLRKLKILPRFAVYILWLIPLIRFWLPFGIANQYSLLNLISKFTTKTVIIRQELPQITTTNSIMAANQYFPLEYKTDLVKNVLNVASLIWIIVSCAVILILVLLCLERIKGSSITCLITLTLSALKELLSKWICQLPFM